MVYPLHESALFLREVVPDTEDFVESSQHIYKASRTVMGRSCITLGAARSIDNSAVAIYVATQTGTRGELHRRAFDLVIKSHIYQSALGTLGRLR